MMIKGGKVVASGGFGCIFKPSLKCENNESSTDEQISKLMINKYAEYEYNQIMKYKKILKNIPNYSNYFILDNFTLCKPNKLTRNDLVNYSKKCKSLKKKRINVNNINQSLDKIKIINMPYGGIDIESFIEKYENIPNLIRLNNSLIELLVNGIVPMNKLNVYHCDIKDSNVLVQITERDINIRLIDWGLSFITNANDNNGIPRNIYRRPFQFNVPFSSIIFNKDFIKIYSDFLVLNPNPAYYEIREFVINYIFIWNDIRGSGHLSAINEMMNKLTINDLNAIKKQNVKKHFIEYDFTYYYIVEYLSKILKKYTTNGSFDLMNYFNNVFLKNIDIWGFTMIYIVLYENLFKYYNKLNEHQMKFISKIKHIIIDCLYESPTSPINISYLIKELTSLNKLIDNFDSNDVSKKLAFNNKMKETIGGFKKNWTRKKKII